MAYETTVLTGSKAQLKLNGRKVAFIGSLNITETNTLTRIDVLDQLESAELAETGHQVSFTCNYFKRDDMAISAVTNGAVPDDRSLRDILSQPGMTMEVFNSVDGRVEYTIEGVKWEGGSGSMDARGVWVGTWNFQGIIGRGM